MISIIIPAHNEAKVIAATLSEFVNGITQSEVEVIIVCNGCTDKTADVVRSFEAPFKCRETSLPSKSNALNIGDGMACGFPRFYLDADVVLSMNAVYQVADVLRSNKILAASPRMCVDTRNATWFVRAYYDVWQQLPYVKEGMIGTGVYALSEEGRKRFDSFPQIIADDGYIRSLYRTGERITVTSCQSLVRAPANLDGLLRIKTRSRLGGYELREKFPELTQNEQKKYASALLGMLKKVNLWPKILLYFYVNFSARLRARKHLYIKGYSGWDKDESSRENARK